MLSSVQLRKAEAHHRSSYLYCDSCLRHFLLLVCDYGWYMCRAKTTLQMTRLEVAGAVGIERLLSKSWAPTAA